MTATVLSVAEDPGPEVGADTAQDADERRPLAELFRDLRTSRVGLSAREAARRLVVYGPNELTRRGGRRWPGELLAQFTQPLAVLLALAAVLAWAGGTPALSVAVVAVILLNAGFAFVQEMQAERAVEALAAFLPATTRVVRDGVRCEIAARDLVPGDVLIVAEGDRVSADARIIDGEVLMDLSALTGESMPASRSAELTAVTGPLLEATDLVFSGTTCTGGEAGTVVTRTGMHTELGRIAALSQRGRTERSPLERQVRRATWIIAIVAVVVGAAFLPAGLLAGLGWSAAISFSIGLIVANVPEGLLPTITLALAVGVRELARRGAVVKRLSAVETLGSTTVICTDKTGTLTENRMRVTELWCSGAMFDATTPVDDPRARVLAAAAAACTTAEAPSAAQPSGSGDPTELAMLRLATDLGVAVDPAVRMAARRAVFHFDARLRRMSTVDNGPDADVVHTKGALETVLPCCTWLLDPQGQARPLDEPGRREMTAAMQRYAARGLRVLAVARRTLDHGQPVPDTREEAEVGLTMIGLVAMVDPPRAGVADAVARAHVAGMRVHVITGDFGLTAAHIAREYKIAPEDITVIHRGVDLAKFDPASVAPERVANLRAQWGVVEIDLVILLPGRLTRWKGQMVLIEALAKLKPQNVRTILAGDAQGRDAYESELRNAIAAAGLNVFIAGHVSDMAAAYLAADIVVSASTDPEAFGRVAAEAGAMGRPVIATDHGGARETILRGASGELVTPGDADALARALERMIAASPQTRAAMGAAARVHIAENFTRERMCADTLALYRRLIAEKEPLG